MSKQIFILTIISLILISLISIILYFTVNDTNLNILIITLCSGLLLISMFIINKYVIIYETKDELYKRYLDNLIDNIDNKKELYQRLTEVYTYKNIPKKILEQKKEDIENKRKEKTLNENIQTSEDTIITQLNMRINELTIAENNNINQNQFNKQQETMSISKDAFTLDI